MNLKFSLVFFFFMQIAHVESIENPGEHFLLANTHLYSSFNRGNILRLIQSIMSAQYLERLKNELLYVTNEGNVKNIRIMYGGDFNFVPSSASFKYFTSKSIILNELTEGTCLKKIIADSCD